MKRFSGVVVCAVVVLASALFAQDTGNMASKEDVEKLFDIMHSRQQVTTLFDLVKRQAPAIMGEVMEKQLPNATPDEKAKMAEFINGVYQKMFDKVPLQEMLDAGMPAYQHHLTHDDVQQLIQFYSSPVGQKFLAQIPAITAEAMQLQTPLLQKWMSEQMSEMRRSAEEFARNLRNQKQKSGPSKQKSQNTAGAWRTGVTCDPGY